MIPLYYLTPPQQRASPDKALEETEAARRMEAGTSYATPGKLPETSALEQPSNAPLVTPADSEEPKDKQVRFDAAEEESTGQTSSTSPRGLVSRRGGRFASPGQRSQQSPKEPIAAAVEYKTYRSPTKDEVPSLCSTNSGQLGNDAPTDSISCDNADTTSPLAQPDTAARKANVTFEKSKAVSALELPEKISQCHE